MKLIMALSLAFLALGCHQPLKNPEVVDSIYQDLQMQATKVISEIKEYDKEIEKAKIAFERAPIRTGQRLEAQEEYFRLKKAHQKLAEQYRYLALKTNSRLKYIQRTYPTYFAEKKEWPDHQEYLTYLTEKKLKNAPREWSPERRIHARKLASQATASAPSSH